MGYVKGCEAYSGVIINVIYDPEKQEDKNAIGELLKRPGLTVIESEMGRIKFSVVSTLDEKVYWKRAWKAAERRISSSASL